MALPIILYDNRFSDGTPTATDTAQGFSVLNVRDMRTYTYWKAASVGTKYLTVDCGSPMNADCLGIIGHNLGSIGAEAVLQGSSDNFASDLIEPVAIRPKTDTAILKRARLISNGDYEVWPDGTNVRPAGWTLAGSGASVERIVVNAPDDYGAQVTAGAGANAQLYQRAPNFGSFKGNTVTYGGYVLCNAPNAGRVGIYDGVQWTYSPYHSGSGLWEYLTVTRTVSSSATELRFVGQVMAGLTAGFDIAAARKGTTISPSTPSDYIEPLSNAKRYWRLKVANGSAAPKLAVLMAGNLLEFPYPPDTPYIPYSEAVEAETARSKKGHPLGAVIRFKPREIAARFPSLSRSFVFDTYKPFWDSHASDLKPFFYAEDLDEFPGHIFYVQMKKGAKFQAPLSRGSLVDSLTLDMEGVRE